MGILGNIATEKWRCHSSFSAQVRYSTSPPNPCASVGLQRLYVYKKRWRRHTTRRWDATSGRKHNLCRIANPSQALRSVALVRHVCAPRVYPRALPVVLAKLSYHHVVGLLPLATLGADRKDSRTRPSACGRRFDFSGTIAAPARDRTSGSMHVFVAPFWRVSHGPTLSSCCAVLGRLSFHVNTDCL